MPAEVRIAGSAVLYFVVATIFLVVEYFRLGRARAGWQGRSGGWDDSGLSVVIAIVLYGFAALYAVLWIQKMRSGTKGVVE
jgi:hypothetical protein